MTPQGDPSMVKIIHYLVLGVLALGAVYYVWTKPPTINPMLDRRGADALAMVQTHRALGYPTILQAMDCLPPRSRKPPALPTTIPGANGTSRGLPSRPAVGSSASGLYRLGCRKS